MTLVEFDLSRLLGLGSSVDCYDSGREKRMKLLSSVISASDNAGGSKGDEVTETFQQDEDHPLTLPSHIASMRPFLRKSHAHEAHRGNLRIFTDKPGSNEQLVSIPSNVVSQMENSLEFVRDIAYKSEATEKKSGGRSYDYSEAVVWCTSETDGEVEFCSRVFDDMPISQLYFGRKEGKQISLELDSETREGLLSSGMLRDAKKLARNSHQCSFVSDDLNVLDAVLTSSAADVSLDRESERLLDLIDKAVKSDPLNESNQPKLVLVASSIMATKLANVVSIWKSRQRQSAKMTEDLLNLGLTIVTFGSVCRSFPTGPAYIHVSMFDDPLAAAFGATSRRPSPNKNKSRVYDAVYLHAFSPYDHDRESQVPLGLKSHDSHNPYAGSVQLLALVMRINGLQSFRSLYDSAMFTNPLQILDINPKHFAVNYNNQGELIIPPMIDYELLPAMIVATGGDQWLWDRSGGAKASLPDDLEAACDLEESFGYSAFEEIHTTCQAAS